MPRRGHGNPYYNLVFKVTPQKTLKRGDRMSFGVPPMKIPRDLYDLIMEAVTLRKHLETYPDDEDALHDVLGAEGGIPSVADYYKGFDLPHKWKYDPNIAITLVANNHLVPLEDKDTITWGNIPEYSPPPPRKLPESDGIPLNEREKEIWLDFTESDKETPTLGSLSLKYYEKHTRSLELDHPIVSFIGTFAVGTFNKVYEMIVNEKEHNRLDWFEFLKCSYIKMTGEYFFYMTIKAVEEGKMGMYETKVLCARQDGSRSLSRFVLTEPTPTPKSAPSPSPSPSESSPESEDDSEGDSIDSSSSESESEDESSLEPDYAVSGMKLRAKEATCRGYDFHTPYGFDGP